MSSTGSGSDSPPRPRIQRSVARHKRAGIIQRRIGPGQPAVPDAGSSSSGSEVVGPLPDQAQRHHASASHVIPAVRSSPRHRRGLDRGPMPASSLCTSCPLNCSEQLSDAIVKASFDQYNLLENDHKTRFLTSQIIKERNAEGRRKYEYHIDDDNVRYIVCRKAFMNIFNVSPVDERRLHISIRKSTEEAF